MDCQHDKKTIARNLHPKTADCPVVVVIMKWQHCSVQASQAAKAALTSLP
jgi:hypothetical protein